jgi:TPR repeat protein
MERAVRFATGAGIAQLQWELGMMHLEGIGTPADAIEAYRWVSRSADGGHVRGMISHAVMLATGEGVAEDDVAARQWYERASRLDDPLLAHALRGLGSMLVNGEGGPAEVPRGIAYLRIAEAGGDGNAPIVLRHFASQTTPDVDREATRIAAEWLATRPRANH